jgi:hypothetical protein
MNSFQRRDILLKCWHINGDERPNFQQITNLLKNVYDDNESKNWITYKLGNFENLLINFLL